MIRECLSLRGDFGDVGAFSSSALLELNAIARYAAATRVCMS
jgi:hypothetical protein